MASRGVDNSNLATRAGLQSELTLVRGQGTMVNLLGNRYRLDAELGRGGMGVVYRAHDTLLDRDVAVKVLNASNLSRDSRARLLREARAAARLNHPNIVLVHDAGEADPTPVLGAGGMPFVVMELVEGKSLFELKPQSLDEIMAVAQQVCAALEHAHAHGIVHRDLKPENVLITPDGTVKLMDFGLARSGASRLSTEGAIIGTVFYLAPEQARGEAIDGRADLYALGVMLYELTTGRLPFSGDDPLAVIAQHLYADVVPPCTLRADLPPAMEAIILKLLAKLPDDRFTSAREVASALAEAAQGRLPRLAVTPRHNLPIQLTSFVGREQEIAGVKQMLSTSRLVTLTGTGGCGKTRLALKVAEDCAQFCVAEYPDGVWLVELAPVSDPALVPQTVAALLGVREEPGRALAKTLADYLRPKSLLLILDNCEHLIEACAQLAETFLRACPNVKVLATSREAFGIPGETSFRVPSLVSPHPHRPSPGEDVMSYAHYEAVRLFLDRATSVRPDFQVTAANALALAQICHRLDGLPLAIELAAARVSAMTVDQIAARLDDRFRLLTGGSRTALPRQQTLKALIDWSWDLLSEVERTLLRRLSVFVGGWTLEAAENVTTGDGLTAPEVLDALAQLVNKSLVVMEDQGGSARYHLLETIREYARDRLIQAGEAEAVRRRHLDFFLRLAEMAEPGLRRADQIKWLAQLETEHDNLRAVLKWSLHSGALEAGWRIAGDLALFWYLRGYWNEGRDWLEQLFAQERDVDLESAQRARAKALCGAGWLADDAKSATTPYTEALGLWRKLGDGWGVAFALRGLGAEEWNQGNLERATVYLDESLALFSELGDEWGVALAMFNLGWVAFNRDDTARAETLWEEGLGLFRQSGDRWGTAVTLSSFGYIARLKGDYARAGSLSRESLALFRELGDKAGIATSLNRLANVALRRSEYREATALLEESLALERERGDRWGLVTTLNLLGLVACYQGDYSRAEVRIEESLAIGREIDDEYNRPIILGVFLALVMYYRSDVDGAAALWRENLASLQKHEDRTGIAFAQSGLGLVAYCQGDYQLARERLEEGLAYSRVAGDKRYVAIALNGLAKAMRALGDEARALALFIESLSLRKEMGTRRGIAESLEGLAGMAAEAEGDDREAARLFGAAEALREAIGAPVPLVERAEYDRNVATARAQLDEATFASAWAEGRAMTLEQAVATAMETRDK
jgi:predicted ATPase